MLVSVYNNQSFDDVLFIYLQNDDPDYPLIEKEGNIVRIANEETGKTIGYNFFNASELIDGLEEDSPFTLTESQVNTLNEALDKAGFNSELVADESLKFVVGHVKECVPHEDSDHLSITQMEVDNGEVLQIVCGAANIAQGQKVVVAKPGAVMPDGLIIWPGELRGVASYGMICSARELNIEDYEGPKGIMELPADTQVGSEFNF